MVYKVYRMAWSKDWEREVKTFSKLSDARIYAIKEIAKKKRINGVRNGNYAINDGKGNSIELIQARNDGRKNYIVLVRGPGGNKSYLQILNASGRTISPQISVYSMEVGWGKYPWGIKY